MDALTRFDEALRAMKQAALDLQNDGVCREEDTSGTITALAMLEMVGRRVRCQAARGASARGASAGRGVSGLGDGGGHGHSHAHSHAPARSDWRERQLPAGDR